MTTALRPLSTGELLDRTFSLYRSHFGLFIGIFALPQLIVFAYNCVGLVVQAPLTQPNFQISNALIVLAWAFGAAVIGLIAAAVSQAATVVAVSQVHLDRPASVMDSFARVKGDIAAVVVLSFITNFVAAIALIAFIAPGVILFILWSLAVQSKVLEGKGIFDAMSRSMELTKGSRGRIFVIGLLIVVLSIGISWLLQWPVLIAAGVSAKGALQKVGVVWQVASLITTFASQCLVGPLATIALSLVYYDQRVRKEAFDLQLMMTTLDASALPGSPAQAGA